MERLLYVTYSVNTAPHNQCQNLCLLLDNIFSFQQACVCCFFACLSFCRAIFSKYSKVCQDIYTLQQSGKTSECNNLGLLELSFSIIFTFLKQRLFMIVITVYGIIFRFTIIVVTIIFLFRHFSLLLGHLVCSVNLCPNRI